MKNKKVPPVATGREDKKLVKIKSHETDDRPVWRFSTVDKNGPFKWPKGENEELKIVGKLHDFDSMSWFSIEGKQHHYLSGDSLSREAKKRLEQIGRDDEIESLFSFHLKGKPRLIAIRYSNVANLLWYDPEHAVAPSRKKHT